MAVLMGLPGTAGAASLAGAHYIGPVTGNPEKDAFASVVETGVVDQLCIDGQAHYVGRVTGNPESDNYAYPVSDVAGATCSAGDNEHQRERFQQRWLPLSRFGDAITQ